MLWRFRGCPGPKGAASWMFGGVQGLKELRANGLGVLGLRKLCPGVLGVSRALETRPGGLGVLGLRELRPGSLEVSWAGGSRALCIWGGGVWGASRSQVQGVWEGLGPEGPSPEGLGVPGLRAQDSSLSKTG